MAETFSDLPDALVRDILAATLPVAETVRSSFAGLLASRDTYRQQAQSKNLIKRKADLEIPREPSVVGLDGSYQIHRLTSLDLCATAAVAVEGTAKEARKHWQEPFHRFWASTVPHNESTTLALRGMMIAMEMELAHEAPHDLVLLDGSFASLIIYLNQGLKNVTSVPLIGDELRQRWSNQGMLANLLQLLRSDKVVAVPKYTSRNELAFPLGIRPESADGRTLATLMLEPGEYTTPLQIYWEDLKSRAEDYHLPVGFCSIEDRGRLNSALQDMRIIYFRPFGWVPALRLELPGPVANSSLRLATTLQGIVSQYFSPAVIEPYPLFLADRMVKSLGAGTAVMEQAIAQQVVDSGDDIELKMLLLQNYRTEAGRGGV